MISRVCFILLIASIRGLTWVLEQPSSSILECHPDFVFLMSKVKATRFVATVRWNDLCVSPFACGVECECAAGV